jgi:large conductance mechanosensitive channel
VRHVWQEFKQFAFKGNMIDLAVGVIIGAAFGRVVSSLVDHVFMPLVAALGAGGRGYEKWSFWLNGSEIKYGQFIGSLVYFLIVAVVVFVIIMKLLGSVLKRVAPPTASEPTQKECPLCLSNIPMKARRCAHCTADLPVTA